MTFVKICGISDEAGLEAALKTGADAVGFVFDPAARRYVSPTAARPLAAMARGSAITVGVFVTSEMVTVGQVAGEVGLDAVQWAGGGPPPDAFVTMADVKHIAVFHLAEGEPFPDTSTGPWAFLTDAHGAPGGSGRLANWEAAREGATRCRLLLAGGLTPRNVGQAIESVRPFGVDVSSGVETAGRKDPRKVAEFVRAVREHDA